MKTRAFGRDGVQVSEVGLGTWQLGSDWGEVGDDAARRILSAAVDQGITFYDTADVYGPEVQEHGQMALRGSSSRGSGRVPERSFLLTMMT